MTYARVVTIPISMRVNDDFSSNFAFMRVGVQISVVADDHVLWSREVWQRGVWFRFRPCYARRIARATRKANKISNSLGLVHV